MSFDFNDFMNALDENEFDETPVDLETFLYSKDFMALPELSPLQFEIVRRGSQVYKEHTLVELHGEEKGKQLWKQNCKELIFALGKGAGKDLLSEIICIHIVYQLLCLKDPAKYYGKPEGDHIDIVNVAINAKQANNVFFAGLKTRIKYCKWFAGKYKSRQSDIAFDKEIRIHSLNSEGEGTEGLNILVAVLDEIDGFDEGKETQNAQKMFNTLNGTVSSRFDQVGKVLLLSFTRSLDGFMLKHYNDAIAQKETIYREHTFKLDEDSADGTDGNEFTIRWEEDHVVSYKYPHVMAFRRPTWDVNPTKSIDTFKMDFFRNPADALGRFACCPEDHTDGGWFKDKSRIDAVFSNRNGLDEDGSLVIVPDPTKEYYIHVDLARVQDNCGIAMAHVDSFKQFNIGNITEDPTPYVIIDLVKMWKPDRERPIDFSDVREFIFTLRQRGFNIKKVTFDRWNSDLIMEHLTSAGITTDKLSVGRDHYSEFALAMITNMMVGPDVELLRKELKMLVVLDNGRIDHTNKSSKDLSDAVCGAFYNASTLTPRNNVIDIITHQDIILQRIEEAKRIQQIKPKDNVIRVPKAEMPQELKSYLDEIKLF